MAQKKYVSLNKLSDFLDNLKSTFAAFSHKHSLSDLTDYTIDSQLSSTSTNPVQNKVIDAEFEAISTAMNALDLAIDGKANATHPHIMNDITDLKEATQDSNGLLSANDKIQLDYGGTPIVTTSGDGAAYIATVDGVATLTNGMRLVFIPHTNSTTINPTLNINSLGAKYIRMPVTYNTSNGTSGVTDSWLVANKPVTVMYNGSYWLTVDLPRPSALSLSGTVPVASGGTGATNVTSGSFLVGNGANAMIEKTPTEVLSHLGLTATADELNYMDGVTSNVQVQLDLKANKADIATTAMQGTASESITYWKISNFGNWGAGNWTAKGFSMLITSRAGEMIWVSLAANDSNTDARAIRLINRYSKINALHYSVSESAIYVTAAAWANNICAHILSNVNGDYVPTVASASALPSDAVAINIVEFGINSTSTVVGNSSVKLEMGGTDTRPTYNGNDMALYSDVSSLSTQIANKQDKISTETWTFTLEDGTIVEKAVYVG